MIHPTQEEPHTHTSRTACWPHLQGATRLAAHHLTPPPLATLTSARSDLSEPLIVTSLHMNLQHHDVLETVTSLC